MKRFRTKQIKWYEKDAYLNESIKTGLELAFSSDDFQQATPFFRCKDYLQDAVFNSVNKNDGKIFGFLYDPKIDPALSFSKTKILVTNSQDFDFRPKIESSLNFLNQLEKELKIQPTKVFKCNNPPKKYIRSGVWLFDGSNRWMKSPPMISFYGLMIRVGTNHKIGNYFWKTVVEILEDKLIPHQLTDKFRLQKSLAGIRKILKIGDRRLFYQRIEDNYPHNLTMSEVHNKLGIVSYSQGTSKKLMPYWHRNIS